MDPNGTFVDLGAQDIAARERSPSSRAPRSVFGDALDLARGIVPYLATLTDVVALYSCASPLRDVVAPEMLAQLSADRWQTDLTTPAMIEHVAYHGARSATACIRMQHVDISCKQPQVVTDGTDQQTADRVVEAAPVRDNELLRVAKWCHYMDTLVADRCNITDAGLYHACVCLARNDFFTRVSLRQCAPLSDLRGLALCATLRSVDCSMTNVDAAGVAPLASLPLLAELRLLRCRRLVSVDAIAGSASIELLDITACPIR